MLGCGADCRAGRAGRAVVDLPLLALLALGAARCFAAPANAPPAVVLASAPAPLLDPARKLVLGVASVSGDEPLSCAWSVQAAQGYAPPAVGLAALPAVTCAEASLVLPPAALPAGATLLFTLTATAASSQQQANASVLVTTATPPSGGTLVVSPSSGAAFSAVFTLSTAGWSTAAPPLTYRFAAVLPSATPDDTPAALAAPGAAASLAGLALPQGNITVAVYASVRMHVRQQH